MRRRVRREFHFFRFGGFPEAFVRGDSSFYRRCFSERKTLLLREDIRNASAIREISLLEHLAHLIPERIGSPLSLNALKGVRDCTWGEGVR